MNGWWAKIRKKLYQRTHHKEFYSHHIGFFFEEAYRELKKNCYDCIIIENRPGYAYRLSARGNHNLVLHLHNDRLYQGKKHSKELFDSFNKIITVSDFIKKRVQTLGEDDKVVTIHNGIDLKHFSAVASCSNCNRNQFGFSEDDFVIVFSGRTNKEKGIAELIDAMLTIKDNEKIKLLIIGSTFYGKEADDNEFIRSLRVKAKGIANKITFTGFIPYSLMPDYLRIADIAVLPSIWEEPFGLTIAEAQAVGLPIITTKCGGIPEVATHQNAIILDANDNLVASIASAILDLYHHPEKRKAMSIASIERSKLFDKERYAREFFHVIDSI